MQFKVEPFDYLDSAKFVESWSAEDKALLYAVTGGIPLYLNKLKENENLETGIKNEFLKKNGSLYEEPRNLLMQELREPAVYNAIITAIAGGSSKLNEISTKVGEESKKVSKYLTTLNSLHLVKKELPIVGGQERSGLYRLNDNMFRFWYRFVLTNHTNIEAGMFDYVYKEKISPKLSEYLGHIFEDICIQYMVRQNKEMKLPFVFDKIGRWWGNNPILKRQDEIDLIAISNNSVIFGECKWKDTVGVDVLESLKEKSKVFNQFDKKHYYLFSKGSFTDTLKEIATKDDSISLIELSDIYNHLG